MEEETKFLLESVKKLADLAAEQEAKINDLDSRLTDVENMLN